MKSDEIRARYLEFFRERGHVVERSDKLVPSNDPTLLFTSAGMVQFKPYYTGEAPVPYRRAATSQKCLRAGGKANDLDEVGKTSRHMTFFEMLGNFSFGDYFKREAIAWGWEFSTGVLGLDPARIWVSVYQDDDEAYGIWEKEIGLPAARIVRLGAKDNFWGPAGDTGACGPCSELLWDRGEAIDPKATLEHDPHERFLEYWNLVFPQFDQQLDGSRPPLKNRGIDTGMGLERLAALLQGKPTVFDVDHVFPIIEATESLSKVKYADNPVPFRVIADHIRALSFLIADGVLPGNEGRGYVERRLLRRAARFGREIGLAEPFLYRLAETVVARMSPQYPELGEKQVQIERIIQTEEQRFGSTLARGMDLIEEIFGKLDAAGDTRVPGEDLFRLHDTYGFPLDLATDIAEDRGYTVDREGFQSAMKTQRERARSAWAGSGETSVAPVYRVVRDARGATQFVGYDRIEAEATVLALIRDAKELESVSAGDEAEVVLDVTPFYAESGGQIGDTGVLVASECEAHVADCKSPIEQLRVHKIKVARGTLKRGDRVTASVAPELRASTQNHHTATHLLQAALQEVLGDHVHQAGSLVAPDRMRFDFTHFEGIGPALLMDIEQLVNAYVRSDTPVEISEMKQDAARALGAMALFGEKYGEMVRVVRVGEISLELCGGTHVDRTGRIGYFKILSEASVSAGVRRIEAVCGAAGVEAAQQRERSLQSAAQLINAPVDKLRERIEALLEENRRLNRELQKWKQAAATGGSVDYMAKVQEIAGIKVLATEVQDLDPAALRSVLDQLRDKLGSGVVILGSANEGKALLCVAVTKDLVGRVKAGDVVRQLAPLVGGGGGGKPELAQAGGKHPEHIPEAIAKAPGVVRELAG